MYSRSMTCGVDISGDVGGKVTQMEGTGQWADGTHTEGQDGSDGKVIARGNKNNRHHVYYYFVSSR